MRRKLGDWRGRDRRVIRDMFALCLPLALTCVISTGCTNSFRGAPERIRDVDAEIALMDALIGDEQLIAAYASSPTKQARNEIIGARLYAIDLKFSQFETALMRERRDVGFLSALAELAVDTSGALVGETASQILSAISAGLTGATTSFDKEILIDQTVQALLTQMRANRAQIANRIYRRMAFDVADYPLTLAMKDLEEYYQGGTIIGALVGINESAGVAISEAQDEAASRQFTFFASPELPSLQEFLFDPATEAVRPERLQQMVDCLDDVGVPTDTLWTDFLFDEQFAVMHPAMIQCLRDNGATI